MDNELVIWSHSADTVELEVGKSWIWTYETIISAFLFCLKVFNS